MYLEYPNLDLSRSRVMRFSEDHLTEKYVAWLNDPEVVRYSEQRHYQHTAESCRDYFQSQVNSDGLFLAIIAKDENLGHIGNMGVSWDAHNCVADVSIMVGDKRAWNKGYASEAWMGLIQYLKMQTKVRKITAGTMASNKAMLNLMLRSGMQAEGVRKAHLLWQGQAVDVVLSATFKEGAA